MSARQKIKIAVDTGGTFTDLCAIDEETGDTFVAKWPSSADHPDEAVVNVIKTAGINLKEVYLFVYGTTVATNCLLERKGANLIFFTTKGFKDILYIQRGDRERMFDLQWDKPKPLVKRRNCKGINERISWNGEILVPLNRQKLREELKRMSSHIHKEKINAFSICLLFSYANPEHEILIKEILEEFYPGIPVSISSNIAPVWREYNRSSTVAVDAYVKPLVVSHMSTLDKGLRENGYSPQEWAVVKSNGGIMTSSEAIDRPCHTLLSGPAGGITAAKYIGKLCGFKNVVSLDMGGTSCDVGVVENGDPMFTSQLEIEWGIPISIPSVDIHTIGAGGGSIGWVDAGGLLHVGPQSAGADPGPACYDRGGEEATLTDANLVLGRLDPDYFLGGRMKLNQSRAYEVIGDFSGKTDLDVSATAHAMIEIANTNMADAVRLITVEKGLDPRKFALVAFGGAGPLHASSIARKLGISKIIIPVYAGVFSAFGFLQTDLRIDRVWTKTYRSDLMDVNQIRQEFLSLHNQALDTLHKQGFRGEAILVRSLNLRYQGQNYEYEVILPRGEISDGVMAYCFQKFHKAHVAYYGYSFPDQVIEITQIRIVAIGKTRKPKLQPMEEKSNKLSYEVKKVHFIKEGLIETPAYKRKFLPHRAKLESPALIEDVNSTILCYPGEYAEVDDYGNILITVAEK